MKITDQALERLGELIALDNAPLELVLEERYEVLERIARGGMGEVFRARDLKLRRDVAIKVLSAELSAPAWTERFRAEAMTMTRIDHPGVVPIHDLGQLPDGRSFYAMKFLSGRTFDSVLRSRPPLRELVRILVQICSVVQHAHERDIIHRDLKPQNVMISDNDQVFVLDWGIAKVRDEFRISLGEDASGAPEGTSAGTILGTIEYMPPEQARGETEALGAAADVYALGAILYEILTGRPPVQGARETALLVKARSGIVKRPRERKPSVPADLDAVCMKALAADPAARYRGARALADDLRRWLEGDAVLARAPSPLSRAWKQILKRKALSASIAAAAILLVSFSAYLVSHREDRSLSEEKRREDEVFGPIRERITQLPASKDGTRRAVEILDGGLARVPRAWGAWMNKARYHQQLGEVDAALAAYAKALEINPRLAEARYQRGEILMDDRQDAAGALAEFRAALEIDPQNEFARIGQARIALTKGEFKKAIQICRDVEKLGRHVADLYWVLGYAYHHATPESGALDLDAAALAYSRAIEIYPRFVTAWGSRGVIKSEKGDVEGAMSDLTRAIELDPSYLNGYVNRAAVRIQKGDLEGAEADCNKALELSPGNAVALSNRSLLRQKKEDLAGALADAQKAVQSDPKKIEVIEMRGNALHAKGDLDAALAEFSRVIEMDPRRAPAWNNRGCIYREKGDFVRAHADFTKAIELTPNFALYYENRGLVRGQQGNLDGAISDLTQSINLDSSQASAWGNRSFARHLRKDHDGAIADATRAMQLNPRETTFILNRARAHRAKGNLDDAAVDFEKVIGMLPATSPERIWCEQQLKEIRPK